MAYARWSNSDIYFYQTGEGNFICEGTSLEGLCGMFDTVEEAIQHLEWHEDCGHNIGRALIRLREEEEEILWSNIPE